MLGNDGVTSLSDFRRETTNDSGLADSRNLYKVELWDARDRIERMLVAGTSIDRARTVFADYARHLPAARLTIRQRSRALLAALCRQRAERLLKLAAGFH